MATVRTCLHNRWTPSERVFFRHTASIFLAGRQPACKKSPCLTKKSLAHPASPGYEYRFLLSRDYSSFIQLRCYLP